MKYALVCLAATSFVTLVWMAMDRISGRNSDLPISLLLLDNVVTVFLPGIVCSSVAVYWTVEHLN